MKKIILSVLLLSTVCSYAQEKIVGNWEGKLSVNGKTLRIIFHITSQNNKLSTKLDSPDQGVFGIALEQTEFADPKLTVTHPAARIVYDGMADKDFTTLTGTWKQNGAAFELVMTRSLVEAKAIIPTQTPKPPFPYHSEDVEFDNESKTIHYGSTFTYPKTGNQFPVIILITGSGQQDRDETLGPHKPFAVIADYLTKKGFAVLRTDDRGAGKSTGNFTGSTTADFANDTEAAIHYIKTRKEVNSKKIGLMGHSEGGMIAPMVAARNKSVAFIVLLAGPGIPITEGMTQQSLAIMRTAGIKEEALTAYGALYKKMIIEIPNTHSKEEAIQTATSLFHDWQTSTPKEIVLATTGVTDSTSAAKFASAFAGQVYTPWFTYFLKYDPQPALRKLGCPVLALNGEKDVQVIAKSNLGGIRSSLEKSKTKKFELVELPGLNHLFQTCKACSVSEYFVLEETFSPQALETISNWLDRTVK